MRLYSSPEVSRRYLPVTAMSAFEIELVAVDEHVRHLLFLVRFVAHVGQNHEPLAGRIVRLDTGDAQRQDEDKQAAD